MIRGASTKPLEVSTYTSIGSESTPCVRLGLKWLADSSSRLLEANHLVVETRQLPEIGATLIARRGVADSPNSAQLWQRSAPSRTMVDVGEAWSNSVESGRLRRSGSNQTQIQRSKTNSGPMPRKLEAISTTSTLMSHNNGQMSVEAGRLRPNVCGLGQRCIRDPSAPTCFEVGRIWHGFGRSWPNPSDACPRGRIQSNSVAIKPNSGEFHPMLIECVPQWAQLATRFGARGPNRVKFEHALVNSCKISGRNRPTQAKFGESLPIPNQLWPFGRSLA